uniref:Uncharacterized protein n=1 Tax=Oryza meridionalis TaxID=40149 RepID=A0A0E0DSI9_9ORYZ
MAAACADPLLRRFDAPFAALVRGDLADLHRLPYSGARKMDRKTRKMQRLVARPRRSCPRSSTCSPSSSRQRRGACADQAPDGRAQPAAAAAEKERPPRRGIGEEAERPDPSRVSGCDGGGGGVEGRRGTARFILSLLELGVSATRLGGLSYFAGAEK